MKTSIKKTLYLAVFVVIGYAFYAMAYLSGYSHGVVQEVRYQYSLARLMENAVEKIGCGNVDAAVETLKNASSYGRFNADLGVDVVNSTQPFLMSIITDPSFFFTDWKEILKQMDRGPSEPYDCDKKIKGALR